MVTTPAPLLMVRPLLIVSERLFAGELNVVVAVLLITKLPTTFDASNETVTALLPNWAELNVAVSPVPGTAVVAVVPPKVDVQFAAVPQVVVAPPPPSHHPSAA